MCVLVCINVCSCCFRMIVPALFVPAYHVSIVCELIAWLCGRKMIEAICSSLVCFSSVVGRSGRCLCLSRPELRFLWVDCVIDALDVRLSVHQCLFMLFPNDCSCAVCASIPDLHCLRVDCVIVWEEDVWGNLFFFSLFLVRGWQKW